MKAVRVVWRELNAPYKVFIMRCWQRSGGGDNARCKDPFPASQPPSLPSPVSRRPDEMRGLPSGHHDLFINHS